MAPVVLHHVPVVSFLFPLLNLCFVQAKQLITIFLTKWMNLITDPKALHETYCMKWVWLSFLQHGWENLINIQFYLTGEKNIETSVDQSVSTFPYEFPNRKKEICEVDKRRKTVRLLCLVMKSSWIHIVKCVPCFHVLTGLILWLINVDHPDPNESYTEISHLYPAFANCTPPEPCWEFIHRSLYI